MVREQESYLDSYELSRVREQTLTMQPTQASGEYVSERRVSDDRNVHIMTLELNQLPPNIDERFVKKHLFQG